MGRHPNFVDLVGQVFGRLQVRAESHIHRGKVVWLCHCRCGNEHRTTTYELRRGREPSCGCAKRELLSALRTVHGRHGTKEYRAWKHMKERCSNPNCKDYPEYGGRGIRVDRTWQTHFMAFFQHIGPAPSARHTVGRIRNDRGYVPGNVRWETSAQQSRNTRRNRIVTLNGQKMPLVVALEKLGIGAWVFKSRLKAGWSEREALETPLDERKSSTRRNSQPPKDAAA